MNILFLDDNEERIQITKKHLPNCVFVKTANECINVIKTKSKWDMILLDYDLDEEQDRSTTGCGMDVVEWLCEQKQDITTIFIHSRNYFGSNQMVKKLLQNGYVILQVPFFDIRWDYLLDYIGENNGNKK